MTREPRKFTHKPSARGPRPFLCGLIGPSNSGKTYSALRLATGMQRVLGGDIWYIDTEGDRALIYGDKFQFEHVRFVEPFSPLDYLDAIKDCESNGARIIVIDSMTHEHNGVGGYMDMVDRWLDKFEDERDRQKNFGRGIHASGAANQRRKLINHVVSSGAGTAFIFCYRAKENLDWGKKDSKGQLRSKGYLPETTSPLQYEQVVNFILPPGCDGVPQLQAATPEEGMFLKLPTAVFGDWLKPGDQISEALGERFARWANNEEPGQAAKAPEIKPPTKSTPKPDDDPMREEARAQYARLVKDYKMPADLAKQALAQHGIADMKAASSSAILDAIQLIRDGLEADANG